MTAAGAFNRGQLRDLGRQVRALRERRGLSLKELAGRSGVSVTGIRNIEFGRANPGLLTVVALLDVLGVSIDELVSLTRRAGNTVHVSHGPAARTRAISDIFEPRMRGRVVAVAPGTDLLTGRPSESGPHFAFVLDGKVRLTLADGSTRDLAGGDAIHLAEQAPKVARNAGGRTARLLWIRAAAGGDPAPAPRTEVPRP